MHDAKKLPRGEEATENLATLARHRLGPPLTLHARGAAFGRKTLLLRPEPNVSRRPERNEVRHAPIRDQKSETPHFGRIFGPPRVPPAQKCPG